MHNRFVPAKISSLQMIKVLTCKVPEAAKKTEYLFSKNFRVLCVFAQNTAWFPIVRDRV